MINPTKIPFLNYLLMIYQVGPTHLGSNPLAQPDAQPDAQPGSKNKPHPSHDLQPLQLKDLRAFQPLHGLARIEILEGLGSPKNGKERGHDSEKSLLSSPLVTD